MTAHHLISRPHPHSAFPHALVPSGASDSSSQTLTLTFAHAPVFLHCKTLRAKRRRAQMHGQGLPIVKNHGGARISHGACMQGALQSSTQPERCTANHHPQRASAQPAVATRPDRPYTSRGLSLQDGVQTSAHHPSSC